MLGVGRLHLVGGLGFLDDLDRVRRLARPCPAPLRGRAWPTRTIRYPSRANRRASAWTLATSGHVASITRSLRSRGFGGTSGATPCAAITTSAPSGTASSSSTKRAPGLEVAARHACCARSGDARRPARRSDRARARRCRSPVRRRRRTSADPRAAPCAGAVGRPSSRRSRGCVRPVDEPAERHDREHLPVQVVVDREVAGEAGAGEPRLVPRAVGALGLDQPPHSAARRCPSARRAARSASSAHAVCDAVEAPRPRHAASPYERMSSPQPPSGFWCASSQRTARRTARVRVGRRRRPARGAPRRCRRRGSRPSARTTSRRAPAAGQQPGDAARRSAAGSAAASAGQHLDDVGGDVGARWVDHLAEVAERETWR